ncbi:hypothetical protein AB5N19_09346 [Seiridium cardinale]|uniref:C2H2-type domain-containing protein n=1 Tax=Seiridium cardinale TaxID=138064 RepID=A0ABR2Y7R8_9PEZI
MDPPAAKKRRLAPKEPPQSQPAFPPHETAPQPQHYPVQEAAQAAPPPPPERHEFESFARHLQDAAMLIYRQSQKSPYSKVSVLILKWEEKEEQGEKDEDVDGDEDNIGSNAAADSELAALEQVLRERYNYRTERWNIPAVSTASVKLGVRMQAFLEQQAPDHLLIVYYSGYAYAGVDNQLFWASNSTEAAAKLKWNGFRCLFDEAPSDMLFLLDTCALREATPPGNGGSLKQIIAANGPEKSAREFQGRSFTALLTDAFARLSAGRPFTAEHLWHEVAYHRQQELLQNSGLTNGASKGISLADKLPLIQTFSRGKSQALSLAPLTSRLEPSTQVDGEVHAAEALQEEHNLPPHSAAGLTFEEPRVLVCTTFVGEASPDMSSFNQWLHNTPGIATKIVVEGMFLGPPTMLLISMPVPVWNVVQHDKVCCFLGYITSKNLTHLYKRLVGSVYPAKVPAEDGRILLEAREAAASTTPIMHRHEYSHGESSHVPRLPETPIRPDGTGRMDPMSLSQPSLPGGNPFTGSTPIITVAKQADVEDSAEMQEAAEQLKALSHVRHLSDEAASAHGNSSLMELTPDVKHDDGTSHEANESGFDEARQNTPSAKPKPRRSLAKVTPKQETRCDLCSHAPFKDSSSLRKHIAAAHTRPFPCAFAFAGCTSTFGSKNEWKRHIASQHLCLTYYRCSSCPQSSVEGKGNEFNRKDLFTQHLRRMHAPFAIKKALAKGDGKLQVEWETHVKEMQTSCLITRRQPPQRSACPKPDCASVFEGPTSWDEWTEHVGRHMEKGEAARLGVDRLLAKWALEEGVIERKEDGEYRLCSGPGSGAEKESNHKNNGAGNHSDANSRDSEDNIVVAVTPVVDTMEVDG